MRMCFIGEESGQFLLVDRGLVGQTIGVKPIFSDGRQILEFIFLQIISAADEVVASIDRDELAKYFALRSDPEDEATEVSVHLFVFFTSYIFNLKSSSRL